jgi:hypothetical protein
MNKILAPLYPALTPFISEIIESGANSFYYGFINLEQPSITTRRPSYSRSNSNTNYSGSNFVDKNEILITNYSEPNFIDKNEILLTISRLKSNNINTFLVFNEHYYNNNVSNFIEDYLIDIIELSDAVIISNSVFFQKMINLGAKRIIASVGTHIFNEGSIKFYKNIGADTIVIPRSVRTDEVVKFAKAFPELEFEYLIFNEFCPFTDGLCRSFHGFPFQSICHYTAISDKIGKYKPHGCRLCNLFDILRQNNINLKIAGRGYDHEIIIKNVKVLNEIRANKDIKNKIDFRDFVKNRYLNYFGDVCNLNCRKDD